MPQSRGTCRGRCWLGSRSRSRLRSRRRGWLGSGGWLGCRSGRRRYGSWQGIGGLLGSLFECLFSSLCGLVGRRLCIGGYLIGSGFCIGSYLLGSGFRLIDRVGGFLFAIAGGERQREYECGDPECVFHRVMCLGLPRQWRSRVGNLCPIPAESTPCSVVVPAPAARSFRRCNFVLSYSDGHFHHRGPCRACHRRAGRQPPHSNPCHP